MDRLQANLLSMSFGATVWSLLFLSSLYLVITVVYRLFFHPLAKFPGPKLAATTKWYEFYFDIIKSPGGQFFHEISRMHDEYGPIIRLNPDEIHIRDPAWFDILYAPNPTKRNKYPPSAEMAGLTLGTHGTVDHDLHRRRRMANSPLFSKRAVASAQDLIHEHVKELAQVFEAKVGEHESLELQTTFLAYTTDVIYHYMFDIDTGYQRDSEAAKSWKNSMEAVAQATPFSKQFPSLNGKLLLLPDSVLQWILSRSLPDIAGLLGTHKLMAKVVAQYVASKATDPEVKTQEVTNSDTKPKTLFHAIDNSNLPPDEKTPLRLTQEGLTVLFAGGETGSRLLSHTVYHLLANPKILEKVKKEVSEAAGDSKKLPDVRVLECLPWLAASVRESLRLRAATTSRLPLVSDKKLVYETWVIPAGIAVSMSHPDVLHNENIFPEPMKFRPERWFHATDEQTRCFVPFGKGTRKCIGMEFAYGEMYMSLATILCRFDLELFETLWDRDVAYTRDCFLGAPDRESPGIRVKVTADNGNFSS